MKLKYCNAYLCLKNILFAINNRSRRRFLFLHYLLEVGIVDTGLRKAGARLDATSVSAENMMYANHTDSGWGGCPSILAVAGADNEENKLIANFKFGASLCLGQWEFRERYTMVIE